MRIAVVGTGYVGAVASTALAWLGREVVGLDADHTRVAQLGRGQVPLYEPGLDELLVETLDTNRLRFTDDARDAIPGADLVLVCVGTPEDDGGWPDLGAVEDVARTVAALADRETVLACRSTVPVGTAARLETLLGEGRVAVCPEFLREGAALYDFLHPDRVVLGGSPRARDVVESAFRPILDQSFRGGRPEARPPLFRTDATAAEMIKYASNAFLATKISFANEIAGLCERLGADVRQVLPALGADPRIGPSFLGPGLGWGGSCLPKDVAGLLTMGAAAEAPTPLLEAVRSVNDGRVEHVLRRLSERLGGLAGATVAVLGLSFKPGTDDLRSSPAVELVRRLRSAGARVRVHDPVVKERPPGARPAADPIEAAENADAVIVATAWPDYAVLDLETLASRMRGDLVFDARDCLGERRVPPGLRIVGVGW